MKVNNKGGDNKHQTNLFSAGFANGNFQRSDWYVDSGASFHFTANEDWIINKNYDVKVSEIMVANKTKLPVKCSGDVEIKTVVGKEYFDILVQNVLYVPEITVNLLSVSQLINSGNIVKFEHNSCRIYNSRNHLVATAD